MATFEVDLATVQRQAIYSSDQFVGRQTELSLVKNKVEKLRQGEVELQPVVNFWAVQGSGKSWLLHHIAHLYPPKSDSSSLKPTLPLLYEFKSNKADNLLSDITRTLAHAALEQVPKNSAFTELKAANHSGDPSQLAKALSKLIKEDKFILILLLDRAEKIPPDKWQEVERHILEPVLVTNGALLIVSGRRQLPPWRTFELRRRVTDTDSTQLFPFDASLVQAQLIKLVGKAAVKTADLRLYTANSPLLVRALVETFQKNRSVEETLFTKAWMQKHEEDLLRPFRRQALEQLLQDVEPDVVDILRAVSPLRFYRLNTVRHMLANQKEVENPDRYYFRLLQTLEPETDLAWWDNKQRAYVTSQIIRDLLNEQKKEDDLATFLEAHQRAMDMYHAFAAEFPAGSEEHLIEILYHIGSIYQVNEKVKSLKQTAQDVLDFARVNLTENGLWTFYKQLEKDNDLYYVLSTPVWNKLKKGLQTWQEGTHS